MDGLQRSVPAVGETSICCCCQRAHPPACYSPAVFSRGRSENDNTTGITDLQRHRIYRIYRVSTPCQARLHWHHLRVTTESTYCIIYHSARLRRPQPSAAAPRPPVAHPARRTGLSFTQPAAAAPPRPPPTSRALHRLPSTGDHGDLQIRRPIVCRHLHARAEHIIITLVAAERQDAARHALTPAVAGGGPRGGGDERRRNDPRFLPALLLWLFFFCSA